MGSGFSVDTAKADANDLAYVRCVQSLELPIETIGAASVKTYIFQLMPPTVLDDIPFSCSAL
ncbi:hypothetical protein COLO4_20340 [Corchorus olitorius]|uniref:Uncharacterized protein n=1 Tax=Corchorus olitorius TaxID=93759 RepID=A0A1R3J088_9ROSI|nr:hypothetical protein COLO4_20340 [Corchorus olitorius]